MASLSYDKLSETQQRNVSFAFENGWTYLGSGRTVLSLVKKGWLEVRSDKNGFLTEYVLTTAGREHMTLKAKDMERYLLDDAADSKVKQWQLRKSGWTPKYHDAPEWLETATNPRAFPASAAATPPLTEPLAPPDFTCHGCWQIFPTQEALDAHFYRVQTGRAYTHAAPLPNEGASPPAATPTQAQRRNHLSAREQAYQDYRNSPRSGKLLTYAEWLETQEQPAPETDVVININSQDMTREQSVAYVTEFALRSSYGAIVSELERERDDALQLALRWAGLWIDLRDNVSTDVNIEGSILYDKTNAMAAARVASAEETK